MNKSCTQCSATFEVTDADRAFYEKISPVMAGKKYAIPEPTLCPDCRMQRRLLFRNERNLYSRTCDKCKKNIISIYAADKPFPVYCSECWWGDGWDATEYGQEIDWNRPFFEQMKELQCKAPALANMVFNSTNCEYNAFIVDSKDCYLSSRIQGENVLYSYLVVGSNDIVDCFNTYTSQRCYECVDVWNCYNGRFLQLCKNCSDCTFCYDCIGCRNCFGCVGLRNKEYYFFNQPCTSEQYQQYLKQYSLGNYDTIKLIRDRFYEEVVMKNPVRAQYIVQSEEAEGNYISESQRIKHSFDVEKSQDIRDSWGVEYSKDVADGSFIYYGEHCYEHISNSRASRIWFTFAALNSNDLLCCIACFNNSHDLFGCIGVKKGQYSILNKSYRKEEYFEIIPRLIEHMKKTGEWGQFLAPKLSYLSYNESLAQDYFPLTKEEALKRSFTWRDENKKSYLPQKIELAQDITKVNKDILQETLQCELCSRNYKIIERELAWYQDMDIALPHICHLCRHAKRMQMRNPRKLWNRTCGNCQKPIQTSYAPDRPEKVYCGECYMKEVL